LHEYIRQSPDDLQNALLSHGSQVVAFDQRGTIQSRSSSVRCSRIDEHGGRLPRVIQIARNHRQDSVGEPAVLDIALDNHRRADLLPRLVLEGKRHKHDIAAVHACFP
jgi:hypothetical protein